MVRFKRIIFMLILFMVVFLNVVIIHGESLPNPIIYRLISNRGQIITKTFTLTQDAWIQYSLIARDGYFWSRGGYVKIVGPAGQIYYCNQWPANVYAGSFKGIKGATYTITAKGGKYTDSDDYSYYDYVEFTLKYHELEPHTIRYDLKLSGPYSDDGNCSQAYNLYLPTNSVVSGCYGRNSGDDFNSVSDIAPINYPVHVWWTVNMSNAKEHNNTSPVFRITMETNGVQVIKTNINGYTSTSGDFELPSNSKLMIYANTGDTYNKSTLGSRTHYSYVIDYSICYRLDDDAPGAPGKSRPVYGYYDPEIQKYFTKSNSEGNIEITWDHINDIGPVFNEVPTISGIAGYKIKVNGAQIEPEYVSQPLNGKVTAVIKNEYFSQYENSVEIQAFDVAGNYSDWGTPAFMIIDNIPPDGPENLTSSITSIDPVIWSWEPAADAQSGLKQYRITITDKSTGIVFVNDTVPAGTNSYSCSGLIDRKTYECVVTAEDKAGNLGQSISNTVIIIRSAPVITLPNYPIRFNNGNLTFSWNPVSGIDAIGFQEYQVAITEDPTPPTSSQIVFTSTNININTCAFNLSSRKTWYLWIRSILQPGIPGIWTMAGSFPDFIINGPENGKVIDIPTLKITISPRTAGKDLRYKVKYQAEADVLETGEVKAGTETTIELPFEANWKWWIVVAEYQNGTKIPESIVVTEAFNLRYDQNNSDTTSRGTLYENEVWWSGIHYITGDVIVPEGLTLTIEPGTQVISITNPDSKPALIIKGEMTTGIGSSFAPSTGITGDWRGIIVEGKSALKGATISHAERGLTVLDGAEVTLTGCTFENNLAGVHAYDSHPAISSCIFRKNDYGIKEDEGGKPVVKDCRFTGNGVDYYHQELTEISLEQLNDLPGNSGNQEEN